LASDYIFSLPRRDGARLEGMMILITDGQQARSAPSPPELGQARVRVERERTEIVALSSALIVKLLYRKSQNDEPEYPRADVM
jgi:hypothetical protein